MKIKNISLVNSGSLKPLWERTETDSTSPTGHILVASDVRFVDESDVLTGKVGLAFGIEYYLMSSEFAILFEEVELIVKVTHPLIVNPETGESSCGYVDPRIAKVDDYTFEYYCFEYEWEVQPGDWIFQVWENNRLWLEKKIIIR